MSIANILGGWRGAGTMRSMVGDAPAEVIWGLADSAPATHRTKLMNQQMGPRGMQLICLTLGLLFADVSPCFAVIVFEKGKTEPTRGYLVSENKSQVVIKEVLPAGELRERVLLRTDITDMIQAVSVERLAKLTRDKPNGYRDYAEELAEKREDPDARFTALRLYLIAAYLDPEKLGRSSLLGMVALSRSPGEERKFRAMAFLLDREHDRSILNSTTTTSNRDLSGITADERKQLSNMLQALRQGRYDEARVVARRPTMQRAMERLAPVITLSDFASLRRGETAPPRLVRKVLTLELMLAGVSTTLPEEIAATGKRSGWSTLQDADEAAPIPQLSLPHLTEFDPQQCHFRDGKWTP